MEKGSGTLMNQFVIIDNCGLIIYHVFLSLNFLNNYISGPGEQLLSYAAYIVLFNCND